VRRTAIAIVLSVASAGFPAGSALAVSVTKPATPAPDVFLGVGAFRWASVVFARYVPGTRDSIAAELTELGFHSTAGVWEIAEPQGTTRVSYPSPTQRTVTIIFRPAERDELPPPVLSLIATVAKETRIGVTGPDVIGFVLDQHGLVADASQARSQVIDELLVGMRDGTWIQTNRTITQLTKKAEPDTSATPLVR
jgi:hypothetical protein